MQYKLDTEKSWIYDCLSLFCMKSFVYLFLSEHINFQQEWNVNWCYTQAGLSFLRFNKEKKSKQTQLGFLFLFMVFSAQLGGSQLWLILPSITVPKESSSFHLLCWWLSGSQNLFKLLPRALKQHGNYFLGKLQPTSPFPLGKHTDSALSGVII